MSFRADIREGLHRAAAAELEHHGCYVVLVSKAIVEDADEKWSQPVCLRLVPYEGHSGMLDIQVREVARRG